MDNNKYVNPRNTNIFYSDETSLKWMKSEECLDSLLPDTKMS